MESETSEWTVVMDRLEKLEKQNRRIKQIGALALILVGSVLLMGQAPAQRTVEANEFIVKDSAGRKRMGLTVLQGGPVLEMFDERGEPASIVTSDGLVFFDSETKRFGSAVNRAILTRTGLFFNDRQGKIVIRLGGSANPDLTSSSEPEPTMSLFDGNEKERLRANANRTGTGAGFFVNDPDGKAVLSLLTDQEKAAITLLAPDKPLGVTLTLDRNATGLQLYGNGSIQLTDSEGFMTTIGKTDLVTPRTGETSKTSAASVVLFDKDKKVLWKAP